MDKRYQVFISSTFQDLQEERQEVMQALLELDCIPAGMELFPAANEDQWTLIKKVIDDCDYYIVIIGGRYGSIGPDGRSYTEMEYRYAIAQGKPVIGFLHKDPGAISARQTEATLEGKAKLEAFRSLAQERMCKFWETPTDLGSQVSRSIIKLRKSTPETGWVRASLVTDESSSAEILSLRKRIEELERELDASRTQAPKGTESLAQGDDEFHLKYTFVNHFRNLYGDTFSESHSADAPTSWNEIFATLSPLMIEETSEAQMRIALGEYLRNTQEEHIKAQKDYKYKALTDFAVADDDFHTVKVQLRALGLIMESKKQRSLKDNATYWKLTPYGDSIMTKLRAIRRESPI